MILLLDYNGIQHYVSESCEKILGFKPEELMGIPVIETIIHPDDQDSTQRAMTLLTNLLELSQTQTGKIRYNPENIALKRLVYRVD